MPSDPSQQTATQSADQLVDRVGAEGGALGEAAAATSTPDTNESPEVPPFAGEPGSSNDPGSDMEEASFEGAVTSTSAGELAGSGLGDAPTGVPQEAK